MSNVSIARASAAALLAFVVAGACSSGPSGADSTDGGGKNALDGRVADHAASDSAEDRASDTAGGGNDTGGAGDAGGGDAAGFVLANVPGLVLWLVAAKGITLHGENYVRNWDDQSGNHNDGLSGEPHPVEEPTLIDASINGLPALHFDPQWPDDGAVPPNCNGCNCGAGNNLGIHDSPTLHWGTEDFLIEVVGRYTNSSTESPEYSYAGTFFFRSSGNGPWFRGNSYPKTPSTGLSALLSSEEGHDSNELITAMTGFNDGKARLMAMQRVGTVMSIRVNGKETDSKTFGSVLDVTGDISDSGLDADGIITTIGASYSDVSRLDGDIAELIAVKGTIKASDLAGIEGYLIGKYAL